MDLKNEEIKFELKELITLVRLHEKFRSVVADGLFPIEQNELEVNSQRKVRINELSRKYGIA